MRPRHVAAVVAIGMWLASLAGPARAGGEPTLSLSAATSTTVLYGGSVRLVGKITPGGGTAGQAVTLRDHDRHVLATTKAAKYGKFSFTYAPPKNRYVHAEWQGHRSGPVLLKVRPRVTASISDVLLFGAATVRGSVSPWNSGAPVSVTVLRDGTAVTRRTVKLRPGSTFAFTVPVSLPGTYRVRAVYSQPGWLQAAALSPGAATPLPDLGTGSTGRTVFLLEHRLQQLHYRITNVNERYDSVTADAVMAFRKVQRMDRTWTVDTAVWRALASPAVPHVRASGSGLHVEVNQTLQVLMTVRDGAITNILHVSTGKPSTPTRDGSFSVWRKVNGYSVGHLYYPSYFDGRRAVHGWTEVPEYAASHGCVRVPYWNARFMYGLMPVGTKVLVYHS